ncbi:hypothetical protein ACTHGU_13315 [Chitinophagaceae bacterium MMS25-I14]
MKKNILLSSAILFCAVVNAQNNFHLNSTNKGTRQDIGVSSGILTFGQYVNNCSDKYPENIDWDNILIGIGTPSPTEQLHTTQGVRFEGLTQDNDQQQVLVQDATGKLYWRDAGTLGGSSGGNFWSLAGNAITTGNFLGTTNNMDVVFKRNNVQAGLLNVSNTSFGVNALSPSSSGILNTAIGDSALASNTTAYGNTANGYAALRSNTTGSVNTASGYNSLYSNTSGAGNTANGSSALYLNTVGTGNTAIGDIALYSNSAGYANTSIGEASLYSNKTGNYNTASGVAALQLNTSGNNNTATGNVALLSNTTGNLNTSNGYKSLYLNQTGSGNTADGSQALNDNISGSWNTAVGYKTGLGITTGIANTIIGSNVSGLPGNLSNTIILADGNGIQRLYIDNAGHAGLATTTPTAALHVNCTGAPLTGASNVRFENLQSGAGSVLVIDANGYVKKSATLASRSAPQEDVDALKAELIATRQDLADLKELVQTILDNKNTAMPASDYSNKNTLEIVPTPFSNNAKAVYSIENFSSRAALQIIGANGTLLKTISITQAKGEVEIGNLEISSGTIIFNIVVEGKVVISKKSVKI